MSTSKTSDSVNPVSVLSCPVCANIWAMAPLDSPLSNRPSLMSLVLSAAGLDPSSPVKSVRCPPVNMKNLGRLACRLGIEV